MSARAMYRASIVVGKTSLPVKLYAAATDRRIHFRLLHEADHVPVVQEMVHSETDEPVAREEIQKGYEVEPGIFVVLQPDELAELAPESEREMPIERFVPRSALDPGYIDRPYYLGPDGDDEGYFALAQALSAKDEVGIFRWVMRKRRYLGALVAEGDYLMVLTLRRAAAVVQTPTIRTTVKELDPKQLRLAEQLIDTLRGSFDPADYQDRYRAKVAKLIENKAAGKKVARIEPKPAAETDDLARALRESLARAKDKRVA